MSTISCTITDMETMPDLTWLVEHTAELLERYPGKWIAVANGELVAVADTAPEAERIGNEKAPGIPLVLEHLVPHVDLPHVSA